MNEVYRRSGLLLFLLVITILWQSCAAPRRTYYPHTSTDMDILGTVDKCVSMDGLQIVSFEQKTQRKSINLIKDQEEELEANISKAIVDNFNRNGVFRSFRERDSLATLVLRAEIHQLKLLRKTNVYGKIMTVLMPVALTYGIIAEGAAVGVLLADEGNERQSMVLLTSALGSLLLAITPAFVNAGHYEIGFTMVLDVFEKETNMLFKSYEAKYSFRRKFNSKENRGVDIITEIDKSFDNTLRELRQSVVKDAVLYE